MAISMNTSCGTLKVSITGYSHNKKFVPKNWIGKEPDHPSCFWTDGERLFYNSADKSIMLNGDVWEEKTWNGFTDIFGSQIWSDGTNTYYSSDGEHYILDKETDTWKEKTWDVVGSSFAGQYVWTDGTNIYYSYGTSHYVLNKETSTWETKTWAGLTNFSGNAVWTDGNDIYCSNRSDATDRYVLNKETDTWESTTFVGLTDRAMFWTDGEYIYYVGYSCNLVLMPANAKGYSRVEGEWKEIGSIS